MLKGKKILLGISGSIAAYKSAMLVRLLVKAGAEVKVIMTESSKDFVTPLTLSTLSKGPVLSELSNEDSWANHVMLGRWADIMIIAPLSCHTLAKMANGFCDNLLMAVYLSATCPIVAAPAMDEDMWLHHSTKENLEKIKDRGNHIIPVDNGELASGLIGEGRMAEPEAILEWLFNFFTHAGQLKGKKALVTGGPTYENIDPVRFVGNNSSGKMGIAIAEELVKRGAEVTLVLGPSTLPVDNKINTVRVRSAHEMYNACINVFDKMDIAVLSAAVADYTPIETSVTKIKKSVDTINLILNKTKDILKTLGESKKKNQLLVGFALETDNEKSNAINKLFSKNADLMILNSLKDEGAGFGNGTNKISIFDKKGGEQIFEAKPKIAVATDIVNAIVQSIHDQT